MLLFIWIQLFLYKNGDIPPFLPSKLLNQQFESDFFCDNKSNISNQMNFTSKLHVLMLTLEYILWSTCIMFVKLIFGKNENNKISPNSCKISMTSNSFSIFRQKSQKMIHSISQRIYTWFMFAVSNAILYNCNHPKKYPKMP